MTIVNSKEFLSNESKYFDLAMNEELFIQRDNVIFIFSRAVEPKRRHKSSDKKPLTAVLTKEADNPKPATRLSDMFRGALSKESAESFIEHTKRMREEWDDI